MKNISGKSCREFETHILCSMTFFENRAVYETMWKNIVERGRPQMTIWRMPLACWIPKAAETQTHTHTHKHRIRNTYCFATVEWLRESVSCYVLRTLCILLNVNFTLRGLVSKGTKGQIYHYDLPLQWHLWNNNCIYIKTHSTTSYKKGTHCSLVIYTCTPHVCCM